MGKKDREEEIERAVRKARMEGEEAARTEFKDGEMIREREQRYLGWNGTGRGPHMSVLPPNGIGGRMMNANEPVGWHGHFGASDHSPNPSPRNQHNVHSYDPYAPPNNFPSSRRRSSASSVYRAVAQKIIHKVDGLARDIEKVGDRIKDLGWKRRLDREKDDLEEELRRCRADRGREMERYFYESNGRDFDLHIGGGRYGRERRGGSGRDCGCGSGGEREGTRFSWKVQG